MELIAQYGRDPYYGRDAYDRYGPAHDRYGAYGGYDRYDRYGYGDRYGGDRYGAGYGDRYSGDRYGDRFGDRYGAASYGSGRRSRRYSRGRYGRW
jgi:hypothetical protein